MHTGECTGPASASPVSSTTRWPSFFTVSTFHHSSVLLTHIPSDHPHDEQTGLPNSVQFIAENTYGLPLH